MKKLQIRNILIPTDFSKTGLLAAKRIVNHSRIPVMSIRSEDSGVSDPVFH